MLSALDRRLIAAHGRSLPHARPGLRLTLVPLWLRVAFESLLPCLSLFPRALALLPSSSCSACASVLATLMRVLTFGRGLEDKYSSAREPDTRMDERGGASCRFPLHANPDPFHSHPSPPPQTLTRRRCLTVAHVYLSLEKCSLSKCADDCGDGDGGGGGGGSPHPRHFFPSPLRGCLCCKGKSPFRGQKTSAVVVSAARNSRDLMKA